MSVRHVQTLTAYFLIAVGAAVAVAQPTGVTGYEVISIGVAPGRDSSSVEELDDFARVVGGSGSPFPTPVVWVNGQLLIVPTPEGYERPQLAGIGSGGVVVGKATLIGGGSVFHPIVWTATQGIHRLGLLPGMSRGSTTCCDDARWPSLVSGGYCFGAGDVATLWTGTRASQLSTQASSVYGVNELGHAVGSAYNVQNIQRPVLWRDGQMIDVGGEPLDQSGGASGINDHGEVVARLTQVGAFHWSAGVRTVLPAIGKCSALAWAINNNGVIAGESNADPRCANGQQHAVVWEKQGGQFQLFDVNDLIPRHPGVRLVQAHDINDAGQIAAYGENIDGDGRGYLVTPYRFLLSDPAPGIAGQPNTITVTGLLPDQRVLLAYGTREGAQKIRPSCPGGTLLIRDPQTSPIVRADADGVATITVNVPNAAHGRTIRMQAIAPSECEISHTVTWTFE